MEYQILSDNLIVKINSKGAELCSVILNGAEYLWQAAPDVWTRHAPVLFPIVGKLKNSTYKHKGKEYNLPQHGFARDKEFKCILKSEKEIVFELESDDDTKKIFPFDFKLLIKYALENSSVNCSYEVSNPSQQNLLFSIGAHPGFNIPLEAHEKQEDYKLKFAPNKSYETTILADGLLSEDKAQLVLQNDELNLSTHLFEHDALVFENSQIELVQLVSTKSGRGVEVQCSNWPYFGIWSKKGCNEFVCLEPWYGITDSENSAGDLTTKKGMMELMPEQKFECFYKIRFF